MSNRPHAHAKRRRSGPHRTFSASTGLTGATEAELAQRAAITEAAMAAAEKSARRAARPPRFTPPRASQGPVTRPPRVFSLPPEPVPSPDNGAASATESAPVDPVLGGTASAVVVEAPSPVSPTRPPKAAPPRSQPKPRGSGKPHSGAAPPDAPPRSPRALVSKLSAAVAASEAMAGKAIRAARSDGVVAPVEAPRADPPGTPSAKPTVATGRTAEVTPAKRPSTTPVPQASRAPKGGSRWRRGSGSAPSTGGANRRTKDKSRPASTTPPETKHRRLALLFAGIKRKRDSDAKASVAKPAAGSTHWNRFSRATPAQAPAAPKKRKLAKPRTPATPEQRRRRIPVAVAGVFAVAVLATSFPLSALLSQRHELSAAAAQLTQVQTENHALTLQQHALDSNVAVNQLARGDYQMVSPGQTLYDVLPPSSKAGRASTTGKTGQTNKAGTTSKTGSTDTTTPGSAVNGDPGNQPLVAPANAPDLNPQAALAQPIPVSAADSSGATATARSATSAPSAGTSTPPPAPNTFWGRVSNTLQFWK